MAITVYGAGAIGGITGAALARAGHDVLLVDRDAAHVEAMNAHGLTRGARRHGHHHPGPGRRAGRRSARRSSWCCWP